MKELGKSLGELVVQALSSFLLGATIIFGLGAASEALPGIIKSYDNLPLWGACIADLITGLVVITLYRKLPTLKEDA